MLLFFLVGEMLSSDNEVIIVGCKQAVVRTIAPGGRHIFYFHIFAGIIGDKVAYHTVPFFYSTHTFGIMKQIAISAAQLIQITHIQGLIPSMASIFFTIGLDDFPQLSKSRVPLLVISSEVPSVLS